MKMWLFHELAKIAISEQPNPKDITDLTVFSATCESVYNLSCEVINNDAR